MTEELVAVTVDAVVEALLEVDEAVDVLPEQEGPGVQVAVLVEVVEVVLVDEVDVTVEVTVVVEVVVVVVVTVPEAMLAIM